MMYKYCNSLNCYEFSTHNIQFNQWNNSSGESNETFFDTLQLRFLLQTEFHDCKKCRGARNKICLNIMTIRGRLKKLLAFFVGKICPFTVENVAWTMNLHFPCQLLISFILISYSNMLINLNWRNCFQ